MIYSKEKWNSAAEIKQHVKVSKAISFEMMEAPLRNAYETYLMPLLGEEMGERLEEIYRSEDRQKEEQRLLDILQKANANLAFYADFSEINLRITDSGFQRQETDDFKTLYQYQEAALRSSFRRKGFDALDRALEYMEAHIDLFPEYTRSREYTVRRTAIVPSAAEVERYYAIGSSRLVFLRLRPHLLQVELGEVVSTLGTRLYTHLKVSLEKPTGIDSKVECLRQGCAQVMVAGAVLRLMEDGGSLTDKGLYFESQESGTDSGRRSAPAAAEELQRHTERLAKDLRDATARLAATAKELFPEYASQNPSRAYDRDNRHRKTFFA